MKKMLFGVLSSVSSAATVSNLVGALGPDADILIHHDWSQQAGFELDADNVSFVQDPLHTGWATWGLSLAVFKLIEVALARHRFDYFQLMTPSCLPIRPLVDLANHLDKTRAAFYVDHVALEANPLVLMSHGYRALAPIGSWRYRGLRRLRRWYFGDVAPETNRFNLSFPTTSQANRDDLAGMRARVAKRLTDLTASSAGFWHPYGDVFGCHVGCSWFGASREGCEYLLEQSRNRRLMDFFSRVEMPSEIMMPTLIANSGLPVAPSNYLLSPFEGARPRAFDLHDLPAIRASERFFARKFPEDPAAPIRIAIRQLLRDRIGPGHAIAPAVDAGFTAALLRDNGSSNDTLKTSSAS